MSEQIEINKVKTDGGTQTRAILNQDTVKEYAAAMQRADVFPPISVFYDGRNYWLADGFHRLAAYVSVSPSKTILADVRQGSQRDAILQSVGANATHGLKRTREDKKRAILRLLEDEEWGKWSDREIARRCHVSHPTVAKLRETVTGKFTSGERVYERNGKTAVMQTAKIGKGETAVVGEVGTNTNLITTVDIATFFDKKFPNLTDRLFVKLIRATADNPDHYLYGSTLGLYMEKHKLHGSKSLLSKLMQRVAGGFEDGGVQRVHKQFLDIAQLTNHFMPFIRQNEGADINAFIAYLNGKNLNYKYDDVLFVVPARLDGDGVEEETAVSATASFTPPVLAEKCPNDDFVLDYTTAENNGVAMAYANCPKCAYESRYQCFKSDPVWSLITESGKTAVDGSGRNYADELARLRGLVTNVMIGMDAKKEAEHFIIVNRLVSAFHTAEDALKELT